MRDDRARLEDILSAIASIARYAERGRPAFDRDELVQPWMIYHLTLIGEAAARLSSALRDNHPEVPWPGVIGVRNILVHGYFAIDLEEVWATVERRSVLYDNHAPNGHHRHIKGIEQEYAFSDVEQLLADFRADVRRVTADTR